MKLLVFSDLHCSARAAHRLVDLSTEADVLVGAGDFASIRRHLPVTIDILKQIEKPIVIVPGNNETLEELRTACLDWEYVHILHGEGVNIQGVEFWGIGGGIPVTPFGAWSYDFSEEEAVELLEDMPKGGVLVSHSPPKGCVDIGSSGRSLGSTTIRDHILENNPVLCVCGHIHDSAGKQDKLGNTTVINAGPKGLWFEIENAPV